ncbi:hypothetical protein [Methanobacterium sp. MBAC-LM]|uniref:hypothetical protein n=1 Tax=Methanobacterium sp. MBAC-LM TaxID=3412034 RepID=UPI003C724D90
MSSEEVKENIKLLQERFKSIADITISYDRYDIIVYNYDEIEDISKFIKEETTIKSWTVLKTKVNPNTKFDWI